MIDIINKVENIYELYSNNNFNMDKWLIYIKDIINNNDSNNIFLEDMNTVISTGLYSFEKDYLTILNNVIKNKDLIEKTVESFNEATKNLENRIITIFNRSIDVKIILYIGLCNGAGWVVNIDSIQYVLLGLEKILELNWYDINSMRGLIYHELGHIYQMQYGVLDKSFNNSYDTFLWQLFTEGIAMLFEQRIIGDLNYFHQNKDNWYEWCEVNINQIKNDFEKDLINMNRKNQRYFGDWVLYNSHSDTGYFLGARFCQWLNNKYSFDEMILLDINEIKRNWKEYINY